MASANLQIYRNQDLMKHIYDFDPTFKEHFKDMLVRNNAILEAAHEFWYNKYILVLRLNRWNYNIETTRNVIEIQHGFFDTLYLLSPECFY
jgi:hypothetical protein